MTLALTVVVAACGPVTLLTGGGETCSIRVGGSTTLIGTLIGDAKAGTAIEVEPGQRGIVGGRSTVPVMWPTGYTARFNVTDQVEVLRAGEVVATTGERVVLNVQFEHEPNEQAFAACGARKFPLDPAPTQ